MAESPFQGLPTSKAWKIIPFFRSSNIFDTVSFYKTTLGMLSGPVYPSESNPRFVSLSCGPQAAANIYFQIFNSTTEDERPLGRAMIALETPEDVVSLHGHLIESGLHRKGEAEREVQNFRTRCDVTQVEDMDWGYQQFTMWDIDGNELTLFSFLDSDGKK